MMIVLSITIVIALLVSIVLPIALGFWLNKKFKLDWRIIFYGAFAYFATQMVNTLLFSGLEALVRNEVLQFSEDSYYLLQVGMTIALSAIVGVLVRWAMMRYMKEKLDTLRSAIGIGLGYGGAESIMIMGLPLLFTFISMIQNAGTELAAEAWALSPFIPLAISVERIAAMILQIAVTLLILQVFLQMRWTWLLAAMGLELLVNGLMIGLSEAGLEPGWVILIGTVFMVGNIFLLYRIGAFNLKKLAEDEQPEPDYPPINP
jgi:uncharacterized membrane protein YhfC